MKKWISAGLIALLLAVALVGCSAKTQTSSSDESFPNRIWKEYPQLKDRPMTKAVVKRVVDGDTFETEKKEKVRLIGVNTPETVKPNSPVEAFGKEASKYTKDQLTGKTVYLFKDTGDKDKYSRLLRYVFIENEPVMFNETLLLNGYANTMTIAPNVMFADKFVKLEREARDKKKGLWAYQ
ncbi:thermonuclease family protein [Paenibacillus sp. MBLB4367]|uniref:thermonuclease family protein n=1 Tax=Paenibacillus sp. MBLB4367 TaxID=3384767 RepID=UPI0039082246